MSGRWKSSKFIRAINKRGGIDSIAYEVERGRSLRSIAAEIGCSRWWLDRWIYADLKRREALTRARVAAAGRQAGTTSNLGE